MKIFLILFIIILLIICYNKSSFGVGINKTVEETKKDITLIKFQVIKDLNTQKDNTIKNIMSDIKTSTDIDAQIKSIDAQLQKNTTKSSQVDQLVSNPSKPVDITTTKRSKEIKEAITKYSKDLTTNKTSLTNTKNKLTPVIDSSRKILNGIFNNIFKENNYIFSNTSFDNNIKFSIEYININNDDISKTRLYLTPSTDTTKETKLTYSTTQTFWDIRKISNTTNYTISIFDPNKNQRTYLYLSNDKKNTYAVCNNLDVNHSYWNITIDTVNNYMYISNGDFYLNGPVKDNKYATLNKTKSPFTINTYPLDKITKSKPGSLTSVKELFKPGKKLILSSDISPGWGCSTFIKNNGFSPSSITIGSNSNDINNPNTAIIEIKYPVIKDSVYQITVFLSTSNRKDTQIIKNTNDVLQYQWWCTAVMDDLITPADPYIITIPKDTSNMYVFNIIWSYSADSLRFTFKFKNATDLIRIDDITITPL
jgi:hypothetical protein